MITVSNANLEEMLLEVMTDYDGMFRMAQVGTRYDTEEDVIARRGQEFRASIVEGGASADYTASNANVATSTTNSRDITWPAPVWKRTVVTVPDNFKTSTMRSLDFVMRALQKSRYNVMRDVENNVFSNWLSVNLRNASVQMVGSNGFADSDMNYISQWTKGLRKALLKNDVPIQALNGILNEDDFGNLSSLDRVSKANERGDAEAPGRLDVGNLGGIPWYDFNYVPELGTNSSWGTVRVNGAITAGATSFVYDGGGSPEVGDAFEFSAGDTSHKVVLDVDGSTVHFGPAATANIADDSTTTKLASYTPSFVADARQLGFVQLAHTPIEDDLDGTPAANAFAVIPDDTSGLVYTLETQRQTGQTAFIMALAIAAGPLNGQGIGILVPH